MKDDTKIVHVGRANAKRHNVVNTPVYRASTIVFEDTQQMREAMDGAVGDRKKVMFYGRKGSPTSWTLEEAMTELEEGFDTVLAPSGLGAITTALMAFLRTGDHLLMVDSVYEPTRHFCNGMLAKFGIKTTYYDPNIGEGILKLITPTTRVVFVESPGSHSFEIQDIPAIADAVHSFSDQNIVIIADNTWGTPIFHKPLKLGADISINACTKYIVGHSDVMLGSITAAKEHFPVLYDGRQQLGVAVSPDDAYLATRGLRTLGVRLNQHQENTMKVATWFSERPEVEKVMYPALPSDPNHRLWKRDFSGATGLFGIVFKQTSREAVSAMLNSVSCFSLGYSWGGYESLICPSVVSHIRTASTWRYAEPGIRLHIGLEDPEDLIADLEIALKSFNTFL
ncbi:MAG: cystathionine beta-lyase [Rhodospirillaceae bacterium]|nr:cystathionine beta-lyase [Rhodospirillaceae bacterium]